MNKIVSLFLAGALAFATITTTGYQAQADTKIYNHTYNHWFKHGPFSRGNDKTGFDIQITYVCGVLCGTLTRLHSGQHYSHSGKAGFFVAHPMNMGAFWQGMAAAGGTPAKLVLHVLQDCSAHIRKNQHEGVAVLVNFGSHSTLGQVLKDPKANKLIKLWC